MKIRFLAPALLLITILQGCSLQDHVLPEPGILPDAARQAIDDRFPGHSALSTSVLEKGRIFAIKFSQSGLDYTVITSRNAVLQAQHPTGSVPDSVKALVGGTAMQGGTFSNGRVVEDLSQSGPDFLRFNIADYELNGVKYSLKNTGVFSQLTDHLDYFYGTRNASDLPDKIQQFLNDRAKANPDAIAALPLLDAPGKEHLSKNNELQFVEAVGWIQSNGKRYYEVSVRYFGMTRLSLLFDGNGDLVWSGAFSFLERWPNLTSPASFDTNLIPAQIDELKGKLTPPSLIADFTPVSGFENWQDIYAGVVSYRASFEHTLPDSRREAWALRFDAGKNLVMRTFYY